MNCATASVASAIVAALPVAAVAQDPCWDNDIVPNEIGGRATSPPSFPDIRVVDDFVVPAGSTWEVCDFHFTGIEDASWTRGDLLDVFIYTDVRRCPGDGADPIALVSTKEWTAEFQGYQIFGRDVYTYWVEVECKPPLDPGRYHIGWRFPGGGGTGTAYWLISDGGEGTDRSGCFSLDAGNTWTDQGAGWHMAFELAGTCPKGCTPCAGDVDEDCDVDLADLLVLLAHWRCDGTRGGFCTNPGVCGAYETCFERENCFCFTLVDGTGFCQPPTGCVGLRPCPNGQDDCPDGYLCAIDTCCPSENVCLWEEARCHEGEPAPSLPPGTITTAGIIGHRLDRSAVSDADHETAMSASGPCEPCSGDLDADCDVDFHDLLQLLSRWGPCKG